VGVVAVAPACGWLLVMVVFVVVALRVTQLVTLWATRWNKVLLPVAAVCGGCVVEVVVMLVVVGLVGVPLGGVDGKALGCFVGVDAVGCF
jgi:hypothetical protein